MLKRFDRENGRRIGFLSAHSVLGMGRGDDEEDKKDYTLLAEKMAVHGNRADLPELFKRMAFNIIIRNTDDHPRNHGFLIRNGRLELSPAYDLVPCEWASDMDAPAFSSMRIGLNGAVADRSNALSMCGVFGLQRDDAACIFDEMTERIALRWRDVFATNGVEPHTLNRAIRIFEHWEKQFPKEEERDGPSP